MPRWLKHFLGILAVMTVAACSGSSSCSSCGMTPLPSGFDPAARIENAASARITDSGFTFVQNNLGALAGSLLAGAGGSSQGGVVQFEVPESQVNGTGYDLTICPGGPDAATGKCVAEIDIGNAALNVASGPPHDVFVFGPVPIRLRSLPIGGTALWIIPVNTDAALSGQGECPGDSFGLVDANIQISIEVERDPAHGSRVGYSKLRIVNLVIDQDQLLNQVHFCGNLTADLLNFLKPLIGGLLLGGFTDTIAQTVNDALCLQADDQLPQPCPNGSNDDGGICKYPDGSCVSIMLGLDGHMDLGAALSSFSPGTTGGLDILFAVGGPSDRNDGSGMAWGDLNPVGGGATLGLFGGAVPNPVSDCITPVPLEIPTGIPIPDELTLNTVPGWTGEGPHMGFALSERFLNYAMGGAYNSGVLCLGISTEQVDLLSTGLFSLLIPSIRDLAHQGQPAPIGLTIRPQEPPTITFGGGTDPVADPLVRVILNKAAIDFYVWSSDRFIRIFTAQFDLDVPVDLDVTAEGLVPLIDEIGVSNAVVTNAGLLKESPDLIGASLADVVGGMAGQALGGIGAIDVATLLGSFGLTLDLQKQGLRKLTKGTDNFLGIFAALGVAPTTTTSLQSNTSVDVTGKITPSEAFQLATHRAENRPRVMLRVSSDLDYGPHEIEYSYRLDKGAWHRWTTNRDIVVDNPYLIMQGKHLITVKSRVVGQPLTEDPTPATTEVTLDVIPPSIRIKRDASGETRVEAWDVVTKKDQLSVRYRFDDGEPTEWMPLPANQLVPWTDDAKNVTVDVKDEEGNVATKRQALIRGRSDAAAGSGAGCGCRISGTDGSTKAPWAALALFGALIGLWGRRRRPFGRRSGKGKLSRALASVAVLVLAGSWTGCNCGDDETPAAPPTPVTPPGQTCGTEGNDPCVVLEPGLIGSYTSAAAAADGTIWVSGYNEADWNNDYNYGDLVVGRWDTAGQVVQWETVDGIPTDVEPDGDVYDLTSWRGGLDAAGDDVGLWTSLALDTAGLPRVAYYDFTNKALKFASYDGTSWAVHTVFTQAGGDAGRYAKLLTVNGNPVIAFQVIEPRAGTFAQSSVMLARGNSPTPASPGDWTMESVAVDAETPCRAYLCAGAEKCVADTGQCTATTAGCDPNCASGEACIADNCEVIFDTAKLDAYPDAIGGYISMAIDPTGQIGIVYYDRIHGNLVQARNEGAWTTAILDGQGPGDPPVDTGDVGIGASLAISSAGDWHIAYVDGMKESLNYLQVTGGTAPQPPELVDDGLSVGGQPFTDGRHIVGDDANLTLSPSGDVRIAYQDASDGKLRYAVGAPASGAGHTWTTRVIEQEGFAGFFPQQVVNGSTTSVLNWWRTGGASVDGNVRLVSP